MNNTERNCDTCNDSYYMTEKNPSGGKKMVQLQHCRNIVYNSPAYTHQMLLEDWGKGFCRLWTPITEKGKNDYGKNDEYKNRGEHIYKENRADSICCPLSFQ